MNSKGFTIGIAFIGAALSAVFGADRTKTNVVAELRSQDNAFALMMESYRQLQVLLIEADYDRRVQLAKSIPQEEERARFLDLAKQERDTRVAKLQQTLKGFDSAYDTSRKELQQKISGVVVTKMTSQEASDQLRKFRPFVPKDFRMENQPSSLLPAGARMLYDDQRY